MNGAQIAGWAFAGSDVSCMSANGEKVLNEIGNRRKQRVEGLVGEAEIEIPHLHPPVPVCAANKFERWFRLLACTRFRRHRVGCLLELEVCHGETKFTRERASTSPSSANEGDGLIKLRSTELPALR